jgi:hypothetical protein
MKKPGTKVPGFVFLKRESLLSNAERKTKPVNERSE